MVSGTINHENQMRNCNLFLVLIRSVNAWLHYPSGISLFNKKLNNTLVSPNMSWPAELGVMMSLTWLRLVAVPQGQQEEVQLTGLG